MAFIWKLDMTKNCFYYDIVICNINQVLNEQN